MKIFFLYISKNNNKLTGLILIITYPSAGLK